MTTLVRMTDGERKERIAMERSRRRRALLYAIVCWLEIQMVDAPKRIREAFVNLFTCTICLLLFAAVFFAALGLAQLALEFWASTYTGW